MNNNPMLIKCKDLVPVMNDATAEGIDECTNDIKISGHAEFMGNTLKALQENCLVEAERFENLTTQGSSSNGTTLMDELLELNCPNNCSGNGTCVSGSCACHVGFSGESCALKSDSVPVMISGQTTCLVDKKSCNKFVVSGNNFLNINLTCQARLLKIYSDGWEVTGSAFIFPARYLNDFNCACIIPDSVRRRRAANSDQIFAEGYLLSISNDGINFSNETTIVIYDSTCYDCDPTNLNCTQYESCDWTPVATTQSTIPKEEDLTLFKIIGGVVGGVGCILIAVLIICLCYKSHTTSKTDVDTHSTYFTSVKYLQEYDYGDMDICSPRVCIQKGSVPTFTGHA
ncbi:von Willebrand factor D and EGF domain-containing protein-like [Pecten maximus]|uniref:von Willebrand factor D and EGF domain-containing protein-like n=1 Tax=Pecten maximus TaxID=6579 RepID=UPI001458D8F1|nr:von Willebrand factor D and EGF domain-containing protein-like [Pecten maximus]